MSEELAKRFHDVYEKFAIEYGWQTQKSCRVEFEDLPKENRDLMVAVVSEVCADLVRDSKRLDKLEIRRLEEENEKLKSDLAQWHDLYEEHNERR